MPLAHRLCVSEAQEGVLIFTLFHKALHFFSDARQLASSNTRGFQNSGDDSSLYVFDANAMYQVDYVSRQRRGSLELERCPQSR